MKDRSNDPSHHERTLLPRSYISLDPRGRDVILNIHVFFNSALATKKGKSSELPPPPPTLNQYNSSFLYSNLGSREIRMTFPNLHVWTSDPITDLSWVQKQIYWVQVFDLVVRNYFCVFGYLRLVVLNWCWVFVYLRLVVLNWCWVFGYLRLVVLNWCWVFGYLRYVVLNWCWVFGYLRLVVLNWCWVFGYLRLVVLNWCWVFVYLHSVVLD